MSRLDAAVDTFKRIIKLDPNNADAYNYIGYMYAERGIRLDEALVLYQKSH